MEQSLALDNFLDCLVTKTLPDVALHQTCRMKAILTAPLDLSGTYHLCLLLVWKAPDQQNRYTIFLKTVEAKEETQHNCNTNK